ncbi:MAG: putative porin [Kiritimatiellales bacterium]
MRKIFIIMTVALGVALGAQAQQSAELAALQQQLNELSAKIAQLEKANAEKTVVAEQAVQLENANAAKIAQIEQDNAKKTWSIEQLQAEGKKDEAASWANDIKLAGDIRARYEKRESYKADGTINDKDRQRIRLRVGAYGKVNDFTDFGLRLATGGSRTSSNSDLGDSGNSTTTASGMKDIWLDQAYVDMHPELLGGAHLFLGKMPQPWITYGSGLIWDTDLNPEGAALTYEKQFIPFKLKANAGSFVMRENNLTQDIQLWSGQVALEKAVGPGTLTMGVSDYYFDNANSGGANNLSGSGVLNTDVQKGTTNQFHLVEGFGSYGFTAFKLPVLLMGQYVVNTEAINGSEDTAYLTGITIGKAKEKGSWEIGYSWRDIGRYAVVAGLNDSDFAGETWAGCRGHRFSGKYQVFKNMSADLAYILSTDWKGRDANTLQADLNFKF